MRLSALPVCLLLALPVHAETILRLVEVGQVAVHPDQLAASLRADADGSGPVEVQARVNVAITAALAQAKAAPGITVTTSNYSVFQQQANPQAPRTWHASQGIELAGADGPALLALVGKLQASGLAVGQLGWRLAPATARSAHAQAASLALSQLRGHADQAAASLGLVFVSFKIVDLDPGAAGVPIRAMANFAAAMPAPSAEAADVVVDARVAAEIILDSKH